jgi:glycosyltransferase involved in cell wall biosynthesis
MRIALFTIPVGIWTQTGDLTLLEKTRRALEKLSVEAELFDLWSRRCDYDIMHIFGYGQELWIFAVPPRQVGIKVVITPIAHTMTPAWRWRAWSIIDRFLPVTTTYGNLRRYFGAADAVLPSSKAELLFLHKAFRVPREKLSVIHHAVDKELADTSPNLFVKKHGLKDFVLMVARIMRRKGQLKVIKALDGLNIPLVFIGYPVPYEPDYFNEFQQECMKHPWVHYLGVVPDDILQSAYAAAKVHVLPSPGECPGLASLEAGMAGANVVAVKDPPVYEHLGDEAYYCAPNSIGSIRDSILKAYEAPRDKKLQERLLAGFTWEAIAVKIIEVYQHLIQERNTCR